MGNFGMCFDIRVFVQLVFMGKEILPLRSFRLKQTETPLEKDTGKLLIFFFYV